MSDESGNRLIWAFAVGLAAGAFTTSGISLLNTMTGLTKSDWASWVQAVGTVGAIVTALFISHREGREAERRRRAERIDDLRPIARRILKKAREAQSAANFILRRDNLLAMNKAEIARLQENERPVPAMLMSFEETFRMQLRSRAQSLPIDQDLADSFAAVAPTIIADLAKLNSEARIVEFLVESELGNPAEYLKPFNRIVRKLIKRLNSFAEGEDYPQQAIEDKDSAATVSIEPEYR